VKVLDFGLAKVTEKRTATMTGHDSDPEAATAVKTSPGLLMGTVNYMSPEQAQAKTVDERTDIWSTAVMLYEMVTGAMPFKGATTSHTIVQILEKDPVPLGKRAKVPAELERIVLKAMAKSPDDRYQTAKDMLIDLRNLRRHLDLEAEIERTSSPTLERADDHPEKTFHDRPRRRILVFALIAMAVVTAAIFGVNIWRSSRARTNASITPPAPVAQRSLTYWITVQKFRNGKPFEKPFTQPGEMLFEADYQIRVNIRSPQAGYLYVLNEGPSTEATVPEFNVVFPTSTANKGSSSLAAGQIVQIPEESWLQFDRQEGTEKLWLIFSSEPLPDFERTREFAGRQTQGQITDPSLNKSIQGFLATHSDPKPEYEKGDTLTTVKSAGNLIVYPIKLQHH
ncbi:MAG TPA: protein kinase, partial [Pyrinomonadaceae bacterium]|nr:protein kinase [Pyrinomonadaceae bacterium]